ncbi:MAG: M23 family metallopeptidase [Spirochaetia bacterium]|nr:M23 family metallopeptidase [Spirochaetia bacterium]
MATRKSKIGALVQKGLDSSIERARQKGNERLTIMLIPHGKEKMFSLQLNYQMIFFLAGILLLAVALAFYGFYRKSQKEANAEKLRNLYGLNFRSAMALKEISDDMRDANENIYSNLREVVSLMGVPDEEIASLPDSDGSASRAERELDQEAIQKSKLGPGRNYLPPVYSLRGLSFMFGDQMKALVTVDRLIGRGVGVFSTMPVGRPFTPAEMKALRDTSGFGWRINPVTYSGLEEHLGQDMAGSDGTQVRCTGKGVIHSAGFDYGYGNRIVVKHANGFFSMYAHLQRILVNPGEPVKRGQIIGLMGRTGRVTGSHLHYEIWLGDQARVDPLPYLCAFDWASEACKSF